ncbi:MAG: serine hydrolase domain-containing protein [Microthrixaceae bacterium]
MTELLAEVDVWGADHAIAVVMDRTGVRESHGDLQHVFAVASLTKLVSALATLVAVEEGAIGLDDLAGPPGATVRHLLSHASGLDFDSTRVLAPAGSRRIYSNTGYDALAEHVQEASGIPFAEYVHDAVLAPLGADGTRLEGSAAKDLHARADDMVRIALELHSPTLVHTSTWADAISAQFPDLAGVLPGWGRQDPCPWGLGPELRGAKSPHWTGSDAAPETYGHFGGSGTFLWVDPTVGLACLVLTDRPFGDWAVEVWPGFSDRVRRRFA